jgi:Protein of unknown function (DUF2612)
MSGDPTPYLGLITSEHQPKPNFMAAVAVSIQPFADLLPQLLSIPALYDLDVAIGPQLDVVGQWVGRSRNIALPLSNVYFSFDENGVGWDDGIWFVEFDPTTNQFALPDEHYRLLLRAKIAANSWNGSIPGAYAAWDTLFGPYGMTILIQDYQDMSMLLAVLGELPDPLTVALLTGGYLSLKPCGVRIRGYMELTVPEVPYFGFDVETQAISGFDVGCWGQLLPSSVAPPPETEYIETDTGEYVATDTGEIIEVT